MNEVTNLIKNHMSIRRFLDKNIECEKIDEIIQCAQMAPTSSHFQAYTIIEVKDRQKREVLFNASGKQNWILNAPLVLLFCGDLHRAEAYFEGIDKDVLQNTEAYTVATIDASLAAQNTVVAAESLGLGCVVVGGIRNDVEGISKEFKLPDMVFPLYAVCYGYPDDVPGLKPRLPQRAIHKVDCYDEAEDSMLINQFDDTVRDYYVKRTNGKTNESWTQRCGKQLMAKPRYEVGYFFRKIGLLKK